MKERARAGVESQQIPGSIHRHPLGIDIPRFHGIRNYMRFGNEFEFPIDEVDIKHGDEFVRAISALRNGRTLHIMKKKFPRKMRIDEEQREITFDNTDDADNYDTYLQEKLGCIKR